MATLEQIIEEARRLPVDEQRRLRAALETIDSNGETQPLNQEPSPNKRQPLHGSNGNEQIRQRRMAWVKSHREEDRCGQVSPPPEHLLTVAPHIPTSTRTT